MDIRIERIQRAARYIRERAQGRQPLVGIVLGSGLGLLAERISDPLTIPYRDLPDFPVSTALGHKGNFIIGLLGGKCVIAMQGRIHFYEGYPMETVVLPVRVMMELGIGTLMVSNAAGGLNLGFRVGDLMIIKDHIKLLPNPLIGPHIAELGPRFPDMTRPYEPRLIALAEKTAAGMGITVKKGVYVGGTGPSYETPAEYKYFRTIGGDAVGMSTVPEVIAARHAGVAVFGMSVITNETHDEFAENYVNDGADVVEAAGAAAEKMTRLFEKMIEAL